jgi:hypothetical protein
VQVLFAGNGLFVLFSFAGVFFVVRDAQAIAIPYLITVLVFPLPYYLTHTLVRYRFPVEPVLTILCVYGLVRVAVGKRVPNVALAANDTVPAGALALTSGPSARLA